MKGKFNIAETNSRMNIANSRPAETNSPMNVANFRIAEANSQINIANYHCAEANSQMNIANFHIAETNSPMNDARSHFVGSCYLDLPAFERGKGLRCTFVHYLGLVIFPICLEFFI